MSAPAPHTPPFGDARAASNHRLDASQPCPFRRHGGMLGRGHPRAVAGLRHDAGRRPRTPPRGRGLPHAGRRLDAHPRGRGADRPRPRGGRGGLERLRPGAGRRLVRGVHRRIRRGVHRARDRRRAARHHAGDGGGSGGAGHRRRVPLDVADGAGPRPWPGRSGRLGSARRRAGARLELQRCRGRRCGGQRCGGRRCGGRRRRRGGHPEPVRPLREHRHHRCRGRAAHRARLARPTVGGAHLRA